MEGTRTQVMDIGFRRSKPYIATVHTAWLEGVEERDQDKWAEALTPTWSCVGWIIRTHKHPQPTLYAKKGTNLTSDIIIHEAGELPHLPRSHPHPSTTWLSKSSLWPDIWSQPQGVDLKAGLTFFLTPHLSWSHPRPLNRLSSNHPLTGNLAHPMESNLEAQIKTNCGSPPPHRTV